MIKIPQRISMLESLIPCGSVCADIGTDHGYLPIALGRSRKCDRIIAADISETCLKKAIRNINAQGFDDMLVEYRIGDGLSVLQKIDSISHVIIAGMGGRQIIEMLAMLPEYLHNATFLLQPMQNIMELRQSFAKLGFVIANEELVSENSRFFEIIEIHKIFGSHNEICYEVENQISAVLGPCIIKKKHPLLLDRANEILEMHIQTLTMIEKAAVTVESRKKADSFREFIEMLRRLIYELQHSDN